MGNGHHDVDVAMYQALGDPYTAWAAAIRADGGTPTSFPPDVSSAPANGTFNARPAARYPAGVLDLYMAPDFTTPDGSFEYFLAPASVIAFVTGGGLVTPQELEDVANKVKPKWQKDLEATIRYAAIAAGLAGAVWFLAPIVRARMSRPR